MLGLFIGSLCVAGLVGLRRFSRHHRLGPWGRYHERDSPWGWGSGLSGRTFLMRALYRRLDTTPGQEKVLREVAASLEEVFQKSKARLRPIRRDVGQAFRSPVFDEVSVGSAVAEVEAALEEFRKASVDAFAKAHDVLDDKQRAVVADVLEKGGACALADGPHRADGHPFMHRCGGGY